MNIQLVQPKTEQDWLQARQLIEAYAASLNIDLCFQNFAHELAQLAHEYAPPKGAFLLAKEEGAYIGCVGLRYLAEGMGEMKRLYISPEGRGQGAGRLLAEGIIAAAKLLGYQRLRLDTLPSMQVAQALYKALGFKPVSAYRFNPVEGTVYMELELDDLL